MKKFIVPKKRSAEDICESFIIESCGVSGYPWKREIDSIVSYITNQKAKHTALTSLDIPHDMLTCFTFIGKLTIDVKFNEVVKLTNSVSGECNGYKFEYNAMQAFLKDENIPKEKRAAYNVIRDENTGKLNYAYIHLNVESVNGNISVMTLSGTLYHEINHLYRLWAEAYPKKEISTKLPQKAQELKKIYRDYSLKFRLSHALGSVDTKYPFKDDDRIQCLLCDLFSSVEVESSIASVYGELRAIRSDIKNWKTDIHQTVAYLRYDRNKMIIDEIEKEFSEDDFRQFYKWLVGKGAFKDKKKGDDDYKGYMIALMKKLNDRYLINIGRAGSLYYNDVNEGSGVVDALLK